MIVRQQVIMVHGRNLWQERQVLVVRVMLRALVIMHSFTRSRELRARWTRKFKLQPIPSPATYTLAGIPVNPLLNRRTGMDIGQSRLSRSFRRSPNSNMHGLGLKLADLENGNKIYRTSMDQPTRNSVYATRSSSAIHLAGEQLAPIPASTWPM